MTQKSTRSNVYALIVGINNWKQTALRSLTGCHNDAALMQKTLVEWYNVPAENIQVLLEEKATHAGIKAAFRSQLIENAKQCRDDDSAAFFFHYSGHGSRCKNPAKPLGKDESIVPWDSRIDGIVDIKDWELGELIDELTAYSRNVTIVMDCCHSGSGTRETLGARVCPDDETDQPDLVNTRSGSRSANVAVQTSQPTMSSPEKYTLIAGCRSDEVAFEYEHHDGHSVTNYGLATFMLCQELRKAGTEQLTYREILDRVVPQLQKEKSDQTPQCEGDVDRVFMTPYRPLRNLFLKVHEDKDGMYWVNAGLAQGITAGSQLHVYPADARRVPENASPLATLVVEEAGAIQSGCTVLTGITAIPLHSRVTVHRVFRKSLQRTVSVSGATIEQLAALKSRAAQSDAAGLFEFVADDSGEFLITMLGGRWGLSASGTVKFWCEETDLNLLIARMQELTQFVNVRAINNDSHESALAGKLKISLKSPGRDSVTGVAINQEIPLASDGMIELTAKKDRVVFELLNESSEDLWFVVLGCGYDGSVRQLYPKIEGTHDLIQKNMTEPFVSKVFRTGFAEGEEHLSNVVETIKVIASTKETDFQCLLREKISCSPLPVPSESGDRLIIDEEDDSAKDGWTAADVSYRIVSDNPQPKKEILSGKQAVKLSGTNLQVISPKGFEATISLPAALQSTRSIDATGGLATRQTSPFDKLAGIGAPLNWRSTRSVGEASLALELELAKDQLSVISQENPLLLKTPQFEVDEDYVVIATDGNLLFPIGASIDPGVVEIDWLPPDEVLSSAGEPASRSLTRTLSLFVYKLLKWPAGSLGLHAARFISTAQPATLPAQIEDRIVTMPTGEIRYRLVDKNQFKTGQRVVLFVHGFNSDSFVAIPKLSQLFEKHEVHYDHLLVFDYESLGTGVRENGKLLFDTLKRAGFSKEDGVQLDIIAHCMGCVVARSMIELEGGHEFVDRCLMAGPPNLGTPLADTGKLVTGLAVTLLNFASSSTIANLAAKGLKKVNENTVGPFDLKPSSKLFEELGKSAPVGTVPYFILAGNAQLQSADIGKLSGLWNMFSKGGNAALAVLFDGQHDLVIGISSMTGVQNGKYPAALLETKIIDANHFEYFDNAAAVQQVVSWLKGDRRSSILNRSETI